MKLKESVKKGLIIASIYLIAAIFVFVATDRIERLNNNYEGRDDIAINIEK